ncbi:MAG: hypothetical protein AB7P40_04325 [Chloroflexota bacterium]
MRVLAFAVVAALAVTTALIGPAAPLVRAQAADLLPSVAELNTTLAPRSVSGFAAGPGADGWDATAKFEILGVPDAAVQSTVDVSELPTPEGAAGFLQTKLQELRTGTQQNGFMGEVGPATADLTFEADEAYWGVYLSSPAAGNPMIVALHVSRFETQVIATTVVMRMNSNGPIPDDAGVNLGIITGQIVHLMNTD